MARRPQNNSGLRELLIAYREYRLPGSPPPPPWSAPRGWPDEMLAALKAGDQVPVSSSTLLGAFIHAGFPDQHYRQFGYGGRDHQKEYLLDENDRLTEVSPGVNSESPQSTCNGRQLDD